MYLNFSDMQAKGGQGMSETTLQEGKQDSIKRILHFEDHVSEGTCMFC